MTLVTDRSEEEVREVVALVNRRLHEIGSATSHVGRERVALLACLRLAEELLVEREKGDGLRSQVRSSSSKLLDAIEAAGAELRARKTSSPTVPQAPGLR